MPKFTDGGGQPAMVKKKDGLLPSKQSGAVTRKTGSAGFKIANQGNAPVRASRKSDGVGFDDGHMDEAMSDGPGGTPAKGPSFGSKAKFDASAMSQAIRKRRG